jgi:TRAP-type C4-dicarboxylate transport system substrate-binding protein
MSELPISHAIGAVVVSKRAYANVSESSREKVREIAADVFARLNAASRDENRRAIEDIRAAGIAIVPVEGNDLAVFRAIGARAAARTAGTIYSPELLARVQATVAEYRAAHASEAP